MTRIAKSLLDLAEPEDYFTGIGRADTLPIPANVLFFLRATTRQLQQEALQNRSHHRFELVFNLRTRGNIHIDSLVAPLEPGQAVLILPYQFHHFSHLASDTIEWLFCTFELAEGRFLEPLRNRVLQPRRGSLEALNMLLTDWKRCHERGRGQLQEAQLQIVLLYLLISLRDDLEVQAPDLPPEPQQGLLRAVNRLMMEWRGRPVSVADIAGELGLSISRLRVLFKQTAGVPLGTYILNYRLNRAMALLRTSDLPIAVVAEEAGFASPQAFSRTFRSKTGQTPRSYRGQT